MEIDKEHIVTQEETGEVAPIEAAEEKVEAELDAMEKKVKKSVEEGLELDNETNA